MDTYTDNTSLIFTNELLTRAYSASQVSGNYAPLFNLNNGIPSWSYPALRADGSTPTVSTNPGSVSPTIVPRNLKTPYVATWNVGLQRELGKDYLVELRWEGSAQVKGFGSYDINTRPFGIIPSPNHDGTMMDLNDPANALYRYQWATNTIPTYQTQWARPYPNLGNINMVCNCYHMDHNAGIVRLEKRFSERAEFPARTTPTRKRSAEAPTRLAELTGIRIWIGTFYKARTAQDQTHNFTGTMNYEVPVGKGPEFPQPHEVLARRDYWRIQHRLDVHHRLRTARGYEHQRRVPTHVHRWRADLQKYRCAAISRLHAELWRRDFDRSALRCATTGRTWAKTASTREARTA